MAIMQRAKATVGDVRVTVRDSEVHSTDNGRVIARRDGI